MKHAEPTVRLAAWQPRSTRVLVWMFLCQALALLSLIPWFLVAGARLADPDGPRAWSWIAAGLWAYPLLPLLCGIGAWRSFWKRRTRAAVVLASLPLAGAIPLLAYLLALALAPRG